MTAEEMANRDITKLRHNIFKERFKTDRAMARGPSWPSIDGMWLATVRADPKIRREVRDSLPTNEQRGHIHGPKHLLYGEFLPPSFWEAIQSGHQDAYLRHQLLVPIFSHYGQPHGPNKRHQDDQRYHPRLEPRLETFSSRLRSLKLRHPHHLPCGMPFDQEKTLNANNGASLHKGQRLKRWSSTLR